MERADDRTALREFAHTTASSMQLRGRLSYEAWVGVGHQIARVSNASAWWLGDWILYGEQEYGMRYKAALDATQLDYQTLRNYAWVARRFEPSRRRQSVSPQHHAEVARLPEPDQDLWLARAARLRWSRNELRRQLRAAGRAEANASDNSALTLHVPVPSDRERLWRQAAAAAEQELVDWVAAAADEAAEAALSSPSSRARPVPIQIRLTRSVARNAGSRRLRRRYEAERFRRESTLSQHFLPTGADSRA
jgi:hypothetical protein